MKKQSFIKLYKVVTQTVQGEVLEVCGQYAYIKHKAFINIVYNTVSIWIDGGFKWCTLDQAKQALHNMQLQPDFEAKRDKFINDGLLLPEKEKEAKEVVPMCSYKVCINGVVSTKRKKIISTFELDSLSFTEVVDSIIYNGYAVSRGSKDSFIYGYETYKYNKEKVEAWIKNEYKL